jgi:hypothetical protein
VFIKRHDEFEVMQTNAARTRAADWGNLVFVHESVRERLMPIVHDAAAAAHERLVDRALWFREQCETRLQVITELKASLADARGWEVRNASAIPRAGVWMRPALPGEVERLRSGVPKVSISLPPSTRAVLEQTIRSVLDQGYRTRYHHRRSVRRRECRHHQRYAPHLAYWVSEPDEGQPTL